MLAHLPSGVHSRTVILLNVIKICNYYYDRVTISITARKFVRATSSRGRRGIFFKYLVKIYLFYQFLCKGGIKQVLHILYMYQIFLHILEKVYTMPTFASDPPLRFRSTARFKSMKDGYVILSIEGVPHKKTRQIL